MEYIIFDLEATCWEEKKERINEIIEIGAVRLSGQLETLDTFSAFVRPTIFPILSQFCQELTGINQENVDRTGIFEEEMKNF